MSSTSSLKIFIIIAALFFAGTAFFFLNRMGKEGAQIELSEETIGEAIIFGEEFKKFTHPQYNFSLEYPKELLVEAFEEEDGAETIIFKKPGQDESTPIEEKLGFQIFITPIEEGDSDFLTPERIREDLPFLTLEDMQEAILGTLGGGAEIRAILFWIEDPVIGKTREVWFTNRGHLYEITTYAHRDPWLAKILATLRFHTF